MKKLIFYFTMLSFTVTVTACQDHQHEEKINKKLQAIKNQQAKPLDPLPKIVMPMMNAYHKKNAKDPFLRAHPNTQNLNEQQTLKAKSLISYPLNQLKWVGTVTHNKKQWALIVAPNDIIYSVTIGSEVGEHKAKIIMITDKEVQVLELIKDGDKLRRQIKVLKKE